MPIAELYGQDAEVGLLAEIIPALLHRTVIDVGAERGGFTGAMISAGADVVHAFEPESKNAASLRNRFLADRRVTVHELAISDIDGELDLHLATDPEDAEVTYGHTVLERPATRELKWNETRRVPARSLGSLLAAGEIPPHVGILKIDTEGHDLSVIAGLGELSCDLVMVEHWLDLPESLGPCPWRSDEIVGALSSRGFRHFAFFVHYGELSVLQWDDATVAAGRTGNLLFLHDRVIVALLPTLLKTASRLTRSLVDLSEHRLGTIDRLAGERNTQARAAGERLASLEELAQERDIQAEAAQKRLATVDELTQERDLQTKTAEERLATLEDLAQERDIQAKAAKERLTAVNELAQERDLQSKTAEERLARLEDLAQERDIQAKAAKERLTAVNELAQERDLQSKTAEERLAALEEIANALDAEAMAAFGIQPLPELDTARLLHDHRLELDRLETEIAEGRFPNEKAREHVASLKLRLLLIEQSLSTVAHPRGSSPFIPNWLRRRLAPIRRFAARMRGLVAPRIGNLRHYEPRPLLIPASYLRIAPPKPAPLISIVTPCFEHGRFLERTLRSVLAQGYPALEYFVQDGASADGTVEILERYAEHLRWVSEQDSGQADAINRAFAHTTGEIMAWLNSDDLLLPGALAYVADYFVTHPNVDVVYGNRVMIDDNDNKIGVWILPAHDDVALTLADYVPQETLFWRRRIWEAIGGELDPSFGYALDWDLLLRFRNAGAKMVRLPRFIGAFRVHDDQKTTVSHALGLAETAQLRERVHGHPLSVAEVNARLRPYFRRHVGVHTWQRVIDRLPLARITVNTAPPKEPSVGTAMVRSSAAAASEQTSGDRQP